MRALFAWVLLIACLIVLNVFSTPAFAQSATQTRLTSSPNPSNFGSPVLLSAEVDGLGGGAPTGDVIFSDGATTLGTAALGSPIGQNQQVIAADGHACAINPTGTVSCWGSNSRGQIGDNTTTQRNTPVTISGVTDVAAIAAGGEHTCALTHSGDVYCWGANVHGQIGDGTTVDRHEPTKLLSLSGIKSITAGGQHTCALTSAGAVLCWGSNFKGQIGDNSKTDRPTPTAVSGLSSIIAAVATGFHHSCAIDTAGAAFCWGLNDRGQLGDGSTIDQDAPVAVSGLPSGVVTLTGGNFYTCALTDAGAALCWGRNVSGQLGDGSTTDRLEPTGVSGLSSDVAAIEAGGEHTCALTTTGAVKCWGLRVHGQIGDGNTSYAPQLVPTQVTNLSSGAVAIALGSNSSCALRSDGSMRCWGRAAEGQLGDGSGGVNQSTPVTVSGLTAIVRAKATLSTSALSFGAHSLTAAYQGDAAHASSSGASNHEVIGAPTQTGIWLNPYATSFGEPATITVWVTASGAAGIPSGTVEIYKDDVLYAQQPLYPSGFAEITVTLPPGSYAWRSKFIGNPGFLDSQQNGAQGQIVNKATTAISLSSSPNPSLIGQSTTLTATVTVTAGAGTPSGSVEFFDGETSLGISPLDAGTATLATAALSLATHTLSAVFSGDSNFEGSTSSTLSHDVTLIPTTTALTSSSNPAIVNQPVTLTATVSPNTATGDVTFKNGATTLGTAMLAGGVASLALPSLPLGSYSLSAQYAGGGSVAGSTGALTLVVNKASAQVSLNPTPQHINPGQTVSLVASVIATPPATEAPTGFVRFNPIGSASRIVEGVASLTTAPLAFGSYSYRAIYPGSSNFNRVGSKTVTVNVDYRTGDQTRVNDARYGPQTHPAIARNPNGEALIVWQGVGGPALSKEYVRARLVRANGDLAGEFNVAGAKPGTGAPQVSALTNGDYVVVWHSNGESGRDIWMRLIAPDGTPRGLFPIRVNTVTAGDQAFPAVSGKNDGGFVVAWQSDGEDAEGKAIIAQRFTSSGAKVGSASTAYPPSTGIGDQVTPSIAAISGGGYSGYVIGWAGWAPDGYSVYALRFNDSGVLADGPGRIDPDPIPALPRLRLMSFDAGAYFLATWHAPESDAASPTDAFMQRYNWSGGTNVGKLRIDTTTAGEQRDPVATGITGGKFVASWTAPDADNTEGVSAQAFSSLVDQVNRIESVFPVNTATKNRQHDPAIAPLGAGADAGKTYIVVWSSQNAAGTNEDIFMQRFVAPEDVALARAAPKP